MSDYDYEGLYDLEFQDLPRRSSDMIWDSSSTDTAEGDDDSKHESDSSIRDSSNVDECQGSRTTTIGSSINDTSSQNSNISTPTSILISIDQKRKRLREARNARRIPSELLRVYDLHGDFGMYSIV